MIAIIHLIFHKIVCNSFDVCIFYWRTINRPRKRAFSPPGTQQPEQKRPGFPHTVLLFNSCRRTDLCFLFGLYTHAVSHTCNIFLITPLSIEFLSRCYAIFHNAFFLLATSSIAAPKMREKGVRKMGLFRFNSMTSATYHIRDRPSSVNNAVSSTGEAVCAVCGDGHGNVCSAMNLKGVSLPMSIFP